MICGNSFSLTEWLICEIVILIVLCMVIRFYLSYNHGAVHAESTDIFKKPLEKFWSYHKK